MREWLSWWSTTLPRSGSRVRVPSRALAIKIAYAAVAQSVERRIGSAEVTGPIPVSSFKWEALVNQGFFVVLKQNFRVIQVKVVRKWAFFIGNYVLRNYQGRKGEKVNEQIKMKRNYRIDNVRALLIILVVVGHLTEIIHYQNSEFVYRWIYIFHMPGFALLSGLCWSGGKDGRVWKKLIYPYVIFQTLYLIFQHVVLNGDFILQHHFTIFS